jgi:hypothetical protein
MSKELAKRANFDKEKLLFIHYSCQSFTDENEGYSPRITSIAVLINNGNILKSYSIHLVAEKMHIERTNIEEHYDEIEKNMLDDFYEFAKNHYDHFWIHWNMTNINFGFEAIEHRYEVLSGTKPYHIDEDKRVNLSRLITNRYGRNCVDDPKMINLMELNGGRHRDYLSGKEEVEAFKAKEYLKLHKSTMSKVKWFSIIYNMLNHNEIKTKKRNWKLFFRSIFEHPIVQVLSLIALLFGLGRGAAWIIELINR